MSSLLHSNQQLLSTRLVESETVFHNDSEWVKRGSAERFDTCLQSEPYVKSGKSWPAWPENTKNVTEGPGSDAGCQFKKDLSLRSRLAGGSRFIHTFISCGQAVRVNSERDGVADKVEARVWEGGWAVSAARPSNETPKRAACRKRRRQISSHPLRKLT